MVDQKPPIADVFTSLCNLWLGLAKEILGGGGGGGGRREEIWYIGERKLQACITLALYPGPLIEGEEKGPGTYCTRMRQLPQENLGYRERLYAFSLSSRA